MQKPFSPHTQFFSSLKHLEKRLKLENHQPPPPSPSPVEPEAPINDTQQTDSVGTPIYLFNQSATTINTNTNIEESEAPQEFLSPPNQEEAKAQRREEDGAERVDVGEDDDMKVLMRLLRLSDINEKAGNDEELYGRIVGEKEKEKERMEGWIQHLLKGERKEPFRLVHLLLAKAAFVNSDYGLLYPSTINQFFHLDPPT